MKLPSIIFVHVYKDRQDNEDLMAYKTAGECIEGDGPTVVGTYKLVGKRTLRKTIVETKR